MSQRLLSLDVFRGVTIFFMIVVNTPGSWNFVYAPLLHAKWDGCTPTDLVFPFFMFIVGFSMFISFQKFDDLPKNDWLKKVISRGIKIIIIGVLLNWFPFFTKNIADLRFYGVLQRIGITFLFAGLLVAFIKNKYLWLCLAVILLSYWGILISIGPKGLTLEHNLVRTLDLFLMSENHLYGGYGLPFDPEGLLSSFSAVGTVILGYLSGKSINNIKIISSKVNWLLAYGIIFVVAGVLWSLIGFPINKPIWSSSYVLFTGGLAMMMLGILMWLIDGLGYQRWFYIFKAFGQNPLISYVISGLLVKTAFLINIGESNLYSWLYDEVYQVIFGDYLGSFMFAISVAMFVWVIAWWMDRKGIIIKV